MMTNWDIFKHNTWQAIVSIDQALHNVGGSLWAGLACVFTQLPIGQTWADETLSSRCHRWRLAGIAWPAKIVNALFFWQDNHCRSAYENERKGRQLPPELR